MGKHGPCYHCGITSTPLWRNGPPEKPVLCNACGSRWRTKGTLANYTPLHAREEPDEFDDPNFSRMKAISINKNKDHNFLKRKQNHDNVQIGDYRKVIMDEDKSKRSSSCSAISNSESCVQWSGVDAIDLTGQDQSVPWDKVVPSKKRSCVNRSKSASIQKLRKDLYTIMHEQQQTTSHMSMSSQEDLLFENDTSMVSIETGHGSVLIRHPSSRAREEESEASSFSVNDNVPRSVGRFVYNKREEFCDGKNQILVKCKNRTAHDGQNRNFGDVNTTTKSPELNHEPMFNDDSYFSPRSLFTLPSDNSSFTLDSCDFTDGYSDQDVLLDVPSHNSFPLAELFHPTNTTFTN